MPLNLSQSEFFLTDVEFQFRWYLQKAGPVIAARYRTAVQATLIRLASHPELGRLRFQTDPELTGLRCCSLVKPFQKQLLFYRVEEQTLVIERTIHGARDLPRRLKEPPQQPPSAQD